MLAVAAVLLIACSNGGGQSSHPTETSLYGGFATSGGPGARYEARVYEDMRLISQFGS
jgi:hypothetical protein